MRRPIVTKVERSSLGTVQARAARRSVQAAVAAELVQRTEDERRAEEQLGGGRTGAT